MNGPLQNRAVLEMNDEQITREAAVFGDMVAKAGMLMSRKISFIGDT